LALVPTWPIAGLAGWSAWVWAGPPLLASFASSGSAPHRSVGWASRQVAPLSRLNPKSSWMRFPKQVGPWVLLAMMAPVAVTLGVRASPSAWAGLVVGIVQGLLGGMRGAARFPAVRPARPLPRAPWHLQDAAHWYAMASLRPGGSTAGQGLMVIVPGSVVWVLALSVTATVKVNVPAVVGVPEIPAGGRGSSARPGGSCPDRIDHR